MPTKSNAESYALDKAIEITAAYASSANSGNELALSKVLKTMYKEILTLKSPKKSS